MKTLAGVLMVSWLAPHGRAQETAAEATSRLSSSAAEELASSIRELDELRGEIAAEKLPLAQELTALEENLARLRREHEEVARLVDAGTLDIARIETEIRAHRTDLDYVANLLDEYARTFEQRVNVSELQNLGEPMEGAKQATENATLSLAEKFGRQLEFVSRSVQRLFEVIGGMRFPGIGVDMGGSVVEGQFAILGPVALFGARNGAAGFAVPQSGSNKPLIRPLEGAMQLGLVALVETGDGFLPFDPSRGGALQALVQKTNLIHIFEKGGPIMWPLLIASILALGTVVERVIFLANERRKRDQRALERFFAEVERGSMDSAVQIGKESKDYVVRTLGYALEHKEQSLPSALLYAQGQELKRFRRGIPILDTVITLAPLLGLLGTVTGMMGSFSLIGGELGAPGAITGGIAEALIATAFGLGIAITALLPFNFLNAKLDDARHEIESAATQLELLVHPQASPAMAVA